MEYNIKNEDGILIQGKGNYCLKFKKGKLKSKKFLKFTRHIRLNKSPHYNQQSKSEVEEICSYLPKHEVAVLASIFENK